MTILEARQEVNMTQKQISEKIGIPVRTLQNYELGIRVCPEWVESLLVEKILSLKNNQIEALKKVLDYVVEQNSDCPRTVFGEGYSGWDSDFCKSQDNCLFCKKFNAMKYYGVKEK